MDILICDICDVLCVGEGLVVPISIMPFRDTTPARNFVFAVCKACTDELGVPGVIEALLYRVKLRIEEKKPWQDA